MHSEFPGPVTLVAHPSTPRDAVQSIQVDVSLGDPAFLTLRYCLQGDLARVRLEGEGSAGPGRAEELWKHTCCEAFLHPPGTDVYYELNFSPARQWAAYRFDSYRQGMRQWALPGEPAITVHRQSRRLELEAAVPLTPGARAAPGMRISLCAVVEEDNGRLCYWSVRHPPGKPDFHHPDAFGLELGPRVNT